MYKYNVFFVSFEVVGLNSFLNLIIGIMWVTSACSTLGARHFGALLWTGIAVAILRQGSSFQQSDRDLYTLKICFIRFRFFTVFMFFCIGICFHSWLVCFVWDFYTVFSSACPFGFDISYEHLKRFFVVWFIVSFSRLIKFNLIKFHLWLFCSKIGRSLCNTSALLHYLSNCV